MELNDTNINLHSASRQRGKDGVEKGLRRMVVRRFLPRTDNSGGKLWSQAPGSAEAIAPLMTLILVATAQKTNPLELTAQFGKFNIISSRYTRTKHGCNSVVVYQGAFTSYT